MCIDPVEHEREYLRELKENFTSNPKKLKKIAIKISERYDQYIRDGLVVSIAASADPVRYVIKCIDEIEIYAGAVDEFIESGKHGMLIHKNTIYPLELKLPKSWLNDAWSPDDEKKIRYDAVAAWMDEMQISEFHGKAVLFKKFGFSGIPRVVHIRSTEKTADMVRFEDTKFMVRKR